MSSDHLTWTQNSRVIISYKEINKKSTEKFL